MGGYRCEHCNQGRNSHDQGYHYGSTRTTPVYYAWCEVCHVSVLAEVLNGGREFTAIDGQSLEDHFVCPDCVDLYPVSELVEYQHPEGLRHCCTRCRGMVPGPA